MTSAPPLPASRRLLFADEFEVPGPPDPARWDYQLDMRYRDSDAQFTDRPANVRVEDGQLVIEARREEAQGRRYTSAELVTLDRFTFCYGRVEVRARLPGGRGTWPGVWLCGANIREVSWPACGEADVVENVGFAPERIVLAAHMPAHNHARGNPIRFDLDVSDARTAFHVYALKWTPDRLEWFLDGRRTFTYENPRTGRDAWPFDHPMYLTVSLVLGGSWGARHGIDESALPQRLCVDFVRVYAPE